MKILFDYQAFYNQNIGGISRSKFQLFKYLNNGKFCKVSIISLFSSNKYLIGNKNETWAFNFFFISKALFFFRLKRTLVRRLVNFKLYFYPPQIFVPTFYDSYFLKSLGKTPFVLTVHDMIHELYFSNSPNYKKVIEQKKNLIFKANAIISVSENTKRDIIKFYPDLSEDKIHVVYWGNSFSNFQYLINDIPKKRKVIFVGKRDDYKNFRWLVNVIYEWIIINDFELICVGGDIFTENEVHLFSILNLSERVTHLILTDLELAKLYIESFALILPSLYEGFGFPILEAMSLNCPVIYNNESSLPEVASYAGLSFSVENPNSLIDNLNKLYLDSDIYEHQKYLGKIRSAEFTWEICAKRTFDVYKTVLNKDSFNAN